MYKISKGGPKPSQQLIQAFITAMELSDKATVAIVTIFVAVPCTIMTIWTLVKWTNNAILHCRGMAIFFFASS